MSEPLKVAIAGLGTVGSGVVELLDRNAALLARRAGRPIKLVAAAALNMVDLPLGDAVFYSDAKLMAAEADYDVLVELIGGSKGIALDIVTTALGRSRSVVTANKAMIAHNGLKLAELAELKHADLRFEAAVAGGIPAIKALREGLAANEFNLVYGILNGTCNYILTSMRETGREFSDVLAEAQNLGYAEADPSFDIDGVDTAHKLAILTSIAFGTEIDLSQVFVEGIRHISALDINLADELGYRIKLLGIARRSDGGIMQSVYPCMTPVASAISRVDGVFNAVVAQGDFVDRIVMEGRGAGSHPTASAVAADLIDIAAGRVTPIFGVPRKELTPLKTLGHDKRTGSFYVRLMVADRPGVIADIAGAFRDENVSMESVLQRARSSSGPVPLVLTVHTTPEAAMLRALEKIAALSTVMEPPRLIRIESF